MSTLEISKHQLYFKKTVISVESWAWQPHEELLQGKAVQTQHLFPLPSSVPTFFWITVSQNTEIKYQTRFLIALQNFHEGYINFFRKTLQEGNMQSP